MFKNRWKAGLLLSAALMCFGAQVPVASAKITIERDNFGVPSIYGDTHKEMFFGFGYAMARDRLIQITKLKIFSSHKFPIDSVQAEGEARFLKITIGGIEYLRSQYPHMEKDIGAAYAGLSSVHDGDPTLARVALDCTAAGISQFLRDARVALGRAEDAGGPPNENFPDCKKVAGNLNFHFGDRASVKELQAFTNRLSDPEAAKASAKEKMSKGPGDDPLGAAEKRMRHLFEYDIWADWTGQDVLKIFFNRIMDEYSNRNEEVNYMDLLRLLESRHENPEKARRIFNALKWVVDPDALTQIPVKSVQNRGIMAGYRNQIHQKLIDQGNACLELEKRIQATFIAVNVGDQKAHRPGFPANASNFWGVVGDRMADGVTAVFMNGPQTVTHDPNSFYPFKIESGAGFKYVGTTFAGTVSFMTGRNDHIGFGFTAGNADVSDMFCIVVKTADGGKTYVGKDLKLAINPNVSLAKTAVYYVDGKDWSVDKLQKGIDGRAVAYIRRLAWKGETGRTFASLLEASQARSLKEWHSAHDTTAVNFNFGAISKKGEATYRLGGAIPNRVGHITGPTVVLQDLGKDRLDRLLWIEDVRLPVAKSPDVGWSNKPTKFYQLQKTITNGYLSSWNNKPYLFMPDSDLYYDSWFKWDRAEIMNGMIEHIDGWNLEKSIQMNRELSLVDINFSRFLPFLTKMEDIEGLNPDDSFKLRMMLAWQGRRDAQLSAVTDQNAVVSCKYDALPVHRGEHMFMDWYQRLANKFSQRVLNLDDGVIEGYEAGQLRVPKIELTNWFARYAKLKLPKLNKIDGEKGTYDNSQNIQVLGRAMLSNLYYAFGEHNSYDMIGWDFFTDKAPDARDHRTEDSRKIAMDWMAEALAETPLATQTPCPSRHIFATRLIKGMRVSGVETEPTLTYFRNKGAQNHVIEFSDDSVRGVNVVAPGVREHRGLAKAHSSDPSRNQLELFDRDTYREMGSFDSQSNQPSPSSSASQGHPTSSPAD